jgi:hypothetical protein
MVDDAVRQNLTSLAFDGASAGRAHFAGGDALHRAIDDVVAGLRRWSHTATEIASALRDSAHRYAQADADVARRIG